MNPVTLFALFLCMADVESITTLERIPVKTGGSVTIPCFYDAQYKSNSKFLCKGYSWALCTIVAHANSNGPISITDHPAQNMFTVQLDKLSDSDSGYYWCAVEISDKWTPDDSSRLYLTVSPDPGVSVLESRVRGEEGGSITIQCLYRASYKNKQKQWCRFKDRSCKTVGKTGTSQNSAVQISDDGRSSFTVQMTGLEKSDAGWYWCSVGDLEVPVHLTITDPPAVLTTLTINEHSASGSNHVPGATDSVDENEGIRKVLRPLVAGGLLLVSLVILILIFVVLKKRYVKNKSRTGETNNDTTAQTSEAFYSSVTFKTSMKNTDKEILQEPVSTSEDAVIYSNYTAPKVSPPVDEIIYSSVVNK